MMWNGDLGAGEWIAMMLMMLVFWGLIAVVAVALIRNFRSEGTRRGGDTPAADPAYQALTDRYARGEIDEEEFTRRRDMLRSGSRF